MKKIFFLLALNILFASCSRNLNNKIIRQIEEKCDKDSIGCQISLPDITNFPWDQMYIFGQITAAEEISNAIGFGYSGTLVGEKKQRMLFTRNHEVVYEEDFRHYITGQSELRFLPLLKDTLSKTFYFYHASDCQFIVKKERKNDCNDCFYYSLNPIANYIK